MTEPAKEPAITFAWKSSEMSPTFLAWMKRNGAIPWELSTFEFLELEIEQERNTQRDASVHQHTSMDGRLDNLN